MSKNWGKTVEIWGAIFARIMSAWGQKGIVGCNVMTIHNEALLLITNDLCQLTCGHFGQGQIGQIHFHVSNVATIYINIYIYIIVSRNCILVLNLTKMTLTNLTALKK